MYVKKNKEIIQRSVITAIVIYIYDTLVVKKSEKGNLSIKKLE